MSGAAGAVSKASRRSTQKKEDEEVSVIDFRFYCVYRSILLGSFLKMGVLIVYAKERWRTERSFSWGVG